jgi:metal iron transporter
MWLMEGQCMSVSVLYPSIVQILNFLIAVGILGATVMPHSLFVGSALATQDRLPQQPKSLPDDDSTESLPSPATEKASSAMPVYTFKAFRHHVKEYVFSAFRVPPKSDLERPKRSLEFVKAHIYHGIVDVAISLLGFAVITNSL